MRRIRGNTKATKETEDVSMKRGMKGYRQEIQERKKGKMELRVKIETCYRRSKAEDVKFIDYAFPTEKQNIALMSYTYSKPFHSFHKFPRWIYY